MDDAKRTAHSDHAERAFRRSEKIRSGDLARPTVHRIHAPPFFYRSSSKHRWHQLAAAPAKTGRGLRSEVSMGITWGRNRLESRSLGLNIQALRYEHVRLGVVHAQASSCDGDLHHKDLHAARFGFSPSPYPLRPNSDASYRARTSSPHPGARYPGRGLPLRRPRS